MDEQKYQKILDYIPHWEPTKFVRVFSVTAIQEHLNKGCDFPMIGFLEAYEILQRLKDENKRPNERW